MNSLDLINKLIEEKDDELPTNDLKRVWDKVWIDKSQQNYSLQRLYKTKDKINTLIEFGVDFYKKRVLDIGCGNGATLLYLKKKYNINGIGIDVSQKIINKIKNDSLSSINGLKFRLGDHRDIELPSNEFDIVLSWGVIEHSTEYIQSLAEARRVLKRGGLLVLIQPHLFSFGVLQKHLLQLKGKWKFGKQKDFSYRHLRKVLMSLGYRDIIIHTKVPYKDMPITRIFDLIVKKIFKYWGHYLYIIAKK